MAVRPVLVLVHGTRFDARQWDGYADLIPEADLVTVDLPGHGERAGAEYSSAAAVAAVTDVLEEVAARVPRPPVVLAGHSLGGYVATTVAEHHPDLIDALVLIGAAADPTRHPILRHLYSGFARTLGVVGPDRMARATNRVLRRLGAADADLPGTTGYDVLPTAWATTAAEAGARQLADLTCPVFLVSGRFDQLGIDTRRYARACVDARVRVIPRATHLAPITHRPQLAAILREAIDAVGG